MKVLNNYESISKEELLMEPVKTNETTTPVNPLFPVMGIGSLLYALLYTICLYHNPSGISYPFYIGKETGGSR